jgi:hypothetical protein
MLSDLENFWEVHPAAKRSRNGLISPTVCETLGLFEST